MQGIIILGGNGTRLNLFSKRVSNKALALVYDHLVFEYPLNTLVSAGITEITFVLGCRYAGQVMDVIGDGKEFGITKINYVYQREAKGISHAIYQAKGFIQDNCAVILGDNFFSDDISKYVDTFDKKTDSCRLFFKKVEDPQRYGVAEFNVDPNKFNLNVDPLYYTVKNIIEKPQNPVSPYAITGLYFYDTSLFSRIEKLKPSHRGELEVTDLNMSYVSEENCLATEIKGYWNDMGTFDSILDTSTFIKNTGFKVKHTINAWK